MNVTLACRSAGIPRRSAYDWRENDADFARRWEEALDEGIDLLEAELQRRAFEGTERPVFYKGQQCGTWRTYSDALAMFLLKAHRPEKYRDSLANQHKDDTPEEEDAPSRLLREIDGRSRGLPNRPEPIEPGGPSFDWDSEAGCAKASTDAPNGALADKSADGTEDKMPEGTEKQVGGGAGGFSFASPGAPK